MVIGVAIIPALWAIFGNHVGLTIAGVSMVGASMLILAGPDKKTALSVTLGLLLGVLWARVTMVLMGVFMPKFNADIVTFVVLFVMTALAIILNSYVPQHINLPSWLGGFAIASTILGPLAPEVVNTMTVQLVIALIFGVWGVGFLSGIIIGACMKAFNKNTK